MKKIAFGIFMWGAAERRSSRYGEVYLGADTYSEFGVANPSFDSELAAALAGKRVRLKAKVIESRESGHVGDMFFKITPSKPEVGEEIDLGVGTLGIGSVEWSSSPTVMLVPADGRGMLWLDPRKLYRLHDQTVELFVEETADDFSPKPELCEKVSKDEVLSTGDGFMQVKGEDPRQVLPSVESLGGGMFVVTAPGYKPAGTRIDKK